MQIGKSIRRWSVLVGYVLLSACGTSPADEQDGSMAANEQTIYEDDPWEPEPCYYQPRPPTNFTATVTSAVRLRWQDNSAEANFMVYRVSAGQGQVPIAVLPANTTSYVDRDVIPGVFYQYYVLDVGPYCGYGSSNWIGVSVAPRRFLHELSSAELSTLASMLNAFLTDPVVSSHTTINHGGEHFFRGHREYIQNFEDYLLARGQSHLVPLPMWNSGVAMPVEMRPVRPSDSGATRPALTNTFYTQSRPASFFGTSLCSYSSLSALGDAASGNWHSSVHNNIGGSMANLPIASAAYIFWSWHAYVDDVWVQWQRHCRAN